MNGDLKPYTGAELLQTLDAATKAHAAGDPTARDGVLGLAQDLDLTAQRGDAVGVQARQARDRVNQWFAESPPGVSLLSYVGDPGPEFSNYRVDLGRYEGQRRSDLLDPNKRQPAYMGEDGLAYVDAAGGRQHIPIERWRPVMDELADAYQGKLPGLGAFGGSMSVVGKAADIVQRVGQMAVTGEDWGETVPGMDVPTADPHMPLPVLPNVHRQLGISPKELYALLQKPEEVRAIQEVLGEAAHAGKLDRTVLDAFAGAAGFLVDFAAVGGGLGALGKAAKLGAEAGGLGNFVKLGGEAFSKGAAQTGLESAGALSSPAIRSGIGTIGEFASYQIVNDAIHGRVSSASDAAASGFAGAKEGALMVGAGLAMGAARTGLTRVLASKASDGIAYRFGSLGKAVGQFTDTATKTATADQLVAKMVEMSAESKPLREQLVRAGWPKARAEMVGHAIDSAAIGLMFGAYHDAIADPEYEKMSAYAKTARMVAGLSSPDAIGGAAAFVGQVVAHGYANRMTWGKEWPNAPQGLKDKLDLDVRTAVQGIAQPATHDRVDAFRRAFDIYRKASPEDFKGVEFTLPWMGDLKMATAEALKQERAQPLSDRPPPEEPPPQGQEAPTGPAGPQDSPTSQEPAGSTQAPEVSEVGPEAPRAGEVATAQPSATEGAMAALAELGPAPKPGETLERVKAKAKKGSKAASFAERIGKLRSRALEGELGFRAYVQALGGLSITREARGGLQGELERYTRANHGETKRLGLDRLVHGPKSKKGMSLATAVERAVVDRMISRDGGEREFLDRLSDDSTARRAEIEGERGEAERLALLDEQARSEGYASYAEAMEVAEAARRENEGSEPRPDEDPDFTLFQQKPPFTRGQQAMPYSDRPSGEMSAEASKVWMATLQNMLFPITEFRNERISGLTRALTQNFGLKADEAEAVAALSEAHAEVWAKQHGKKIEDWYNERLAGITRNAPPLGAPEGARAATTFLADGRAVLHALEAPTLDSVVEEFAHIWRRDLSGSALKALEQALHLKDGVWTVGAEERFAGWVRRYIRSGKAPTPGLKGTFEQLGKWLKTLIPKLRGLGLDVRMRSDVRKAVESIWTLPPLDADVATRERMAKLSPETQAAIYNANRNRPQYVGMELPEIVGHELRGGLPDIERTPAIKLAQAGDSMIRAAGILQKNGALDEVLPVHHGLYQNAILELIQHEGRAFADHFKTLGAESALSEAVAHAKLAQTQMREAAREVLPNEKQSQAAGLFFETLDAMLGTKELAPEMKERLAKIGALRPKGNVDPMAVAAVGNAINSGIDAHHMGGAVKHGERVNGPITATKAWLAYGRPDHEFKATALERAFKISTLVTRMEKAGFPPSLLARLNKIGATLGNVHTTNFANTVVNETNYAASTYVNQPRERTVQLLRARAEDALGRILARFGWRVPPRSHMQLLNWAISSGQLKKMKSGEDFEKIRPGTGYLFDITRDINDVLIQLGNAGVEVHYFAPEQIEKWGGEYRPSLALKQDEDRDIAELREGRTPLSWGSRQLSKRNTPDEAGRLMIEDPNSWLPTTVNQEGRMIQYLGVAADLYHGGYAVKRSSLEKSGAYTLGQYAPIALDPTKNAPGATNGPAIGNWHVLHAKWEEQNDPNSGRPKSKQLKRMLEDMLGIDSAGNATAEGPMYVTRQTLWELDGLNAHTWNSPALKYMHERVLADYEQATRAFRRGLTIGRPKHWTLNIFNSIATNHVLGRLPMWDVLRSVTTGTGYFADALRDTITVLDHAKLGSPKEKPDDWSVEKWDRLQRYHEAFEALNGTTFTGVGLENSVVTDTLSAVVTPDIKTAGMLRDLEAQGHSIESGSAASMAVFDASRRMTGGMAEMDRRIFRALGSHDPAERARAVQNFTSMYQLWEMLFKWAATLRAIDTHPVGTSMQNVVRWAAAGTADYANTSPLMRSFNTSYGTFTNPLFRKSYGLGGSAARSMMREALKGRFWMYSATMTPALLGSVASHPLRAGSVLALGAGITAALHALSSRDPEEEASWQEAHRGSLGNMGAPVVDEATLQILEKSGMGFPNVSGGLVPHEVRKQSGEMYRRLLAGASLVFQAPDRGDETRVSSLEDLAPGWGNWIGLTTGAKNFTANPASNTAEAILDGLSMRSMELSIAIAQMGYGGLKVLQSDGPEATLDAMKGMRQAAADVFPTISPLYLASRDGQRFLEVAALNGQSFDEYARGIIQVDEPTPLHNLGEYVFSVGWRTQRLLQPQLGGVSEREALDGIIGRLFPGERPSSGAYWDKLREAQGQVHYQMSELISGSYENWLRSGRQMASFDAFLVPAMFDKDSPMQRFLGQERDPEKQAMMQRYFNRFVVSDEWQRTLGSMMQVAGTRMMRPDFFRQAITNSMRDPTGQAMLNWIDKRIVRQRPAPGDLEDMASVFLRAVQMPTPGTERYEQWSRVLKAFYDNGLNNNFIPDNAADALRRLGKKPELAGGPALQEALLRR